MSVLFLTIATTLYVAALLGLVLNPYVALCGALAVSGATAGLWRPLREAKLGSRELLAAVVGLMLIAWIRPGRVDSLHWDVVSYGLLKYPEMRAGVVGPYFHYGNVYEFLVSYVDQLLPPLGGIALLHTLSLFFLGVSVCRYAGTTRSLLGLAAGILLLFHDPTRMITPELTYVGAGKNDVLVAALVLQVWAIFLDRRSSRSEPIGGFEFAVTNAVAACAVGIKISVVLAVGLPMVAYWGEFLARTARAMSRWRLTLVLGAVAFAWALFCWQYVLNLFVVGPSRLHEMTVYGAFFSVVRFVGWSPIVLARSSPPVFVVVLTLTALILAGTAQRTARVVTVRLSALLLVLLCPLFFNGTMQWPQWRLVLPALFLAGIDAVTVAAGIGRRLVGPSLAQWTMSRALPAKPVFPATACAVLVLFLMYWLSPRTLPDYTAYFYPDYREAYRYFADMPGQTIYSYGLRPYFLLGREGQHRVMYDLNPTPAVERDPGGLVRTLVDCESPDFLVFSDYMVGNGYFNRLLVGGVEVVSRDEHVVILRNLAAASGRRGMGCSGRYAMMG